MQYTFPHTIENCLGEKIVFRSLDAATDRVILEAYCEPGAGPAMHTHLKQEESLTVVSGTMGYMLQGQQPAYAGPGETVLFHRGRPHRFWAEGKEMLALRGWVQPAGSVVYFLTTLYAAQKKSGKARPDPFAGAYLLTKYSDDYDMPEIPVFVKKVIFPATVILGRILGKYPKDAFP